MPPDTLPPKHHHFRTVLIVLVSVFVVGFIFRLTEAGSLTPSVLPAGTMHTLQEIYDPLASSGYDSSGVVPSRTGNILQVTKCIINKLAGSPCP